MKFAFGCLTNHLSHLDMALAQSEIQGSIQYWENPESATKGLNRILDLFTDEGADVAVLTHQDMFYRRPWLAQVENQLKLLPGGWMTAGIIGKDLNGKIAGKFQDTRIPAVFCTTDLHKFPVEASCYDECCILVNLHNGFRFDETLEGFDLYGTMAVLQTWEAGERAWIIDSGSCSVTIPTPTGSMVVDIAYAQHHCTRPFTWFPDAAFCERFHWLWERFPTAKRIDTTVLGIEDEKEEVA
jgi:hypothetical protein